MIAYFGHPKSGSTWLAGFFLGLAYDLGLKIHYKQTAFYDSNPERLGNIDANIIISQNSSYHAISEISNLKALHVVRDPRDVIVSSYFSYRFSHAINDWKELASLRNKLNQVSFDEGLFHLIDFNKGMFQNLKMWNYNDERILELSFEEVIKDPVKYLIMAIIHFELLKSSSVLDDRKTYIQGKINRGFRKLGVYPYLKFKGSAVSENYIKRELEKLSFDKLAKGRKRGSANQNSHYRKGVSNEWKDLFNQEHKAYFKEVYGDLVVQLGYERDNNW